MLPYLVVDLLVAQICLHTQACRLQVGPHFFRVSGGFQGVGLGVRSREQAAQIAGYADGVIVGSALVSALAKGLPTLRALTEELAAGVRQRISGL